LRYALACRRRTARVILPAAAFALISSGAWYAAAEPPDALAERTTEKRPHERYTHEDVLAMLRASASVIPSAPPVHPVHTMYNREAVVPPMCYTRTEGKHNPCYVCHQGTIPGRPNAMDDWGLQLAYSFSDTALTNHARNLFEDRSQRVAEISDDEILAWIGQDNYSELAPRLKQAGFRGYIPDLENLHLGAEAFDGEGFAKDGSHWVAFNYKPLPSTFWPTNGATDDVMIRLGKPFRTTAEGGYSRDVYKANLALVEANIKNLDAISVRDIDETVIGTDLDGDGALGKIDRITKTDAYVGGAKRALKIPYLYPIDTEFLHSVRYVGVDEKGNIHNPPRMKELRYMRRRWTTSVPQLFEAYEDERRAKTVGELPGYANRGQYGLDNEMGWVIAGFIENREGQLRVQNFEENFFCMGCHTSVGSTIDSTFSFPRKIDGAAGWGYVNLRGMPDAPSMGETRGEIATYLERAGGGGEFRSNPEMEKRWFEQPGVVDSARVGAARDVYELIAPSRERALSLNKAYRVIVEDQDFIFGRDPTVTPPHNVYEVVDNQTAPTLPPELTYRWDIRLDWSRVRSAGTDSREHEKVSRSSDDEAEQQ
jgi:hypothetical protein